MKKNHRKNGKQNLTKNLSTKNLTKYRFKSKELNNRKRNTNIKKERNVFFLRKEEMMKFNFQNPAMTQDVYSA